ncbi:MAG: hypothetical protein QOF60_50 [Actinomycetota bacterium]|jgi:hypothetical protein|nr:hypothetical protein [Actinomycetota bacterium]
MRTLRWAVGVLLLAATSLYAIPSAHAEGPQAYAPVSKCTLTGFVAINPGMAVGADAILPDPNPGTYNFTNVAAICFGVFSGVCSLASNGTTQGTSPTSGFSGSFYLSCALNPLTCDGAIGGPGIGPPSPLTVPTGPWSLITKLGVHEQWTGSLWSVDCTGGAVPVNEGRGDVSLGAFPDPTSLNGPCSAPSEPKFCGLVVVGKMIIMKPVP